MHFDTDGHLVGTSINQPAVGDVYTVGPGLSGGGAQVSSQLGETFGYTGTGAAQSYRTTATVTFTGATLASDTVSVGSTVFTLGAHAGVTAAANDLADQINANTALQYYAQANAGVVTLYAKSGATAANLTASGANIAVDDSTTLTQLVNNINNGVSSTGSIDLTGAADGDRVTLNGVDFTFNIAGPINDAASLAGAINVAGLGVTATSNGGNGVFLTYNSPGQGGDAFTLAPTGGITVSGATLQGGMDDSTTTMVQASVLTSGSNTCRSWHLI